MFGPWRRCAQCKRLFTSWCFWRRTWWQGVPWVCSDECVKAKAEELCTKVFGESRLMGTSTNVSREDEMARRSREYWAQMKP